VSGAFSTEGPDLRSPTEHCRGTRSVQKIIAWRFLDDPPVLATRILRHRMIEEFTKSKTLRL
jgi:hypothetical protein